MADSEPDSLEHFAAVYVGLRQLVADAGDCQWRPGHSPIPREDTTERSKGMSSDPTANIVADTRRLALRVAVLEAEAKLVAADKALAAAYRHLNIALTKWQG